MIKLKLYNKEVCFDDLRKYIAITQLYFSNLTVKKFKFRHAKLKELDIFV